MAFSPIALTIPNYRDFKNYWIKAYVPSTTTPKVMATDKTGSPTVAKFELNTEGFPKTAGGALVTPYIDGLYDLWLFPTEAEADANDTSNALRLAINVKAVSEDAISEAIDRINPATLAIALADTNLVIDDALDVKERTTGNGGGATWDAYALGTFAVGAAIFDVFNHNTLPLQLKLRLTDVINIRQLGATTAAADNTAEIQAAATLAKGKTLDTTNGNFSVLSDITVNDAGSFTVIGNGVIDGTGGTFTAAVFSILGSLTAIEDISNNAATGERLLRFASPLSVDDGDVILINNPTDSSWNAARTVYRAGEFCRVYNSVGSTTNLWSPLYDNYLVGNVDLYKLKPLTVNAMNLSVISPDGAIPVIIDLATQVYIERDTNITNAAITNFEIRRSYNVVYMAGNSATNMPASGEQYAVSISNCQNVNIIASNLYASRHGVNIGGGDYIGSVTNRNVRISHANLFNGNSDVPAGDMHGNVEDIHYDHCTMTGATIAGKNTTHAHCTIYNVLTSFACALGAEIKGGLHEFVSCHFITTGKTVGRGLIYVALDANCTEDFTLKVRGCNFKGVDQSSEAVVMIDNNGATVKVNALVDDSCSFDFTVSPVSFLRVELLAGSASSDFLICDHFTSNTTGAFILHPDGDYANLGKSRLIKQTIKEELTTTAATAVFGSTKTFPYLYPVPPSDVTVTRTGRDGATLDFINSALVGFASARTVNNNNILLQLLAEGAGTFAAGTNFDLISTVAITDI